MKFTKSELEIMKVLWHETSCRITCLHHDE